MDRYYAYVVTILVVVCATVFISRRAKTSLLPRPEEIVDDIKGAGNLPEPNELCKAIASALTSNVVLSDDYAAFRQAMNKYWAQQECEVVPGCIVQPQDPEQLSLVVKLLKREYDQQDNKPDKGGLFAVRSGGHSPLPGAASIKGGVVIDMGLFCEVVPSDDGSSVEIGSGARWADVSKILDERGLAVVGGRNGNVGVGGLCLGGGISFFSPRYGLVCSNVISYEVVLADSSIIKASSTEHRDLWLALKGGSNNFGIVTRFTVNSFPCEKIWSGYLYLPSFRTKKVLTAFHEFVGRPKAEGPMTSDATLTDNQNTRPRLTFDENAAGPLACFSYIQPIGLRLVSVGLTYTKPTDDKRRLPACWKTSGFLSLWRIWNTCTMRTITEACTEYSDLNPNGRRQIFATTTIRNDAATIVGAHAASEASIPPLRRAKVAGLVWTLVLQPFRPLWTRLGHPNPLGLDEGTDEPLVLVSFSVNWNEGKDDDLVRTTLRQTIERIEAAAKSHNTFHRYKYLNYCADWQTPFESYGEENLEFLRQASKKYDPDGLFQRGCMGGFKLDMESS